MSDPPYTRAPCFSSFLSWCFRLSLAQRSRSRLLHRQASDMDSAFALLGSASALRKLWHITGGTARSSETRVDTASSGRTTLIWLRSELWNRQSKPATPKRPGNLAMGHIRGARQNLMAKAGKAGNTTRQPPKSRAKSRRPLPVAGALRSHLMHLCTTRTPQRGISCVQEMHCWATARSSWEHTTRC